MFKRKPKHYHYLISIRENLMWTEICLKWINIKSLSKEFIAKDISDLEEMLNGKILGVVPMKCECKEA